VKFGWFGDAGSADSIDYIFDYEIGTAGGVGADSIWLVNTEVADSVAGFINSAGFVADSILGGATEIGAVISAIELAAVNADSVNPVLTSTSSASEILMFRVGNDTYIGLVDSDNNIGSVVKLVGVGGSNGLYEGATDDIYYIGPPGT
jgi:hypothetical protein